MPAAAIDTLGIATVAVDSVRIALLQSRAEVSSLPLQIVITSPAVDWWAAPLFQTLLGGGLAAGAGIATTAIMGLIDRRRQRRALARAVAVELAVLQYRMILVCVSIALRMGQLDRALVTVLAARAFKGPRIRLLVEAASRMEALEKKSQAELAAMNLPLPGARRSLGLKRYDVPLLEASLAKFELLAPALQSHLLQVRGTLALFNQQVDDAMRYHWLTFESLTDQNHAAVSGNLEKTWAIVFRFAKLLTEQIGAALEHEALTNLGDVDDGPAASDETQQME